MSSNPYFLDTNIWLYVLLYNQDDQDIDRKHEREIPLTNGERAGTKSIKPGTLQALNELNRSSSQTIALTVEQIMTAS